MILVVLTVGGRNIENALYKRIPLLTDVPTIVFGADVTHPSPGEDASPSIAVEYLNLIAGVHLVRSCGQSADTAETSGPGRRSAEQASHWREIGAGRRREEAAGRREPTS